MFVKGGVKSNTLENGIRNAVVAGVPERLDQHLALVLVDEAPHRAVDMALVVEVLAVLLQLLLRPSVVRSVAGRQPGQVSLDTFAFARVGAHRVRNCRCATGDKRSIVRQNDGHNGHRIGKLPGKLLGKLPGKLLGKLLGRIVHRQSHRDWEVGL
jgi:hypothetical protein